MWIETFTYRLETITFTYHLYYLYVANRNKKLNIFRKLILTKKLFVGKVATDTNFAEISSLT